MTNLKKLVAGTTSRQPTSKKTSLLSIVPALTLLFMLGPVCAGMLGTLLASIGYLPSAGLNEFSIEPIQKLWAWPGLGESARLSLTTGIVATFCSLAVVTLLIAGWYGTKLFSILERMLSPLLSIPHAATAFGLAFLIAPSGWVSRLVSPTITGWERPPDLLIVQDSWGLTMTLGLIAKEIPFLTLMALAAIGQSKTSQSIRVSQALGYGRVSGWLKTVFPLVYAQIRLPVYVVLAYSMSVVDVAMILGPSTPPTLSVQIVRWMSEPDLSSRLVASSGAILQLLLVLLGLTIWWCGEVIVSKIGYAWIKSGKRGSFDKSIRVAAALTSGLSATVIFCSLAGLVVWSFAGYWGFPDVLPESYNLKSWNRHGSEIIKATQTTFVIAIITTLIALSLVIGCLEAENRRGKTLSRRGMLLIYLPLLVPQIAFLPGLQTFMLMLGMKSGITNVILAHLVFVLPYMFLSLGDIWRAWDTRYVVIANALGKQSNTVLWKIRLPMLLRPILTAMAVSIAVSIGQYLPTLLVGGGRVSTLTTEAVALTSGGDRRAIGVYGVAQTFAVFIPFFLAIIIPSIIWHNRKGLRG